MQELPVAAHLATDAVRRQFAPDAPPEPDPVRRRPVRRVRLVTAAVLDRAARAVAPAPECSAAH
ncbi:MAG TPA: hypothetical protein VEZ42_08850 [Pseudonocardia sp.]|nr:hypothetical protein [Pseudonocardia sp.]